jgi:hypothetical protein
VFPNTKGKVGAPTDALLRQLTDRVLMELWMRGFAVSARKLADRSPTGERVDPEAHAAWRDTKGRTKYNQGDVEDKRA